MPSSKSTHRDHDRQPAAPAAVVVVDPGELSRLVREATEEAVERITTAARDEHHEAERPLDRKGLADWLGCSLRSVDGLIAEGMPVARIGGPGGSPRALPSEVWAWLKRRGAAPEGLRLVPGGER